MIGKQYRINKQETEKIFRQGKIFRGSFLLLRVKKNSLRCSRFTAIVPMKVSKKAVIRNRFKRCIREILRKEILLIKKGWDIIFLALPSILEKNYSDMENEMKQVLQKAGLFK